MSELPEQGEIKVAQAEALLRAVTQFINEAWQKDCLDPAAESLRKIHELAHAADKRDKARRWVVSSMPQFIYFDRYDVLDSAIHIPTFLQQLASTPNAPRVRTTHCLVRHVGLDLHCSISSAGTSPARKRTIRSVGRSTSGRSAPRRRRRR